MSSAGQARTLVYLVAVACILAGLVRRRRVSQCYSFPVYLLATAICSSLILLWPARFFTPEFYTFKESLYGVLKLALTAELAYRILGHFPGAWRRARILLGPLLVLVLLSATALAAGADAKAFYVTNASLQSWTIWALLVLAMLTVYYNVPVQPWPWAILSGLSLYLAVFTSQLNFTRAIGLEVVTNLLSQLNGMAYLALAFFWTWRAWRPDPTAELSAELERRLRTA